MKQIVFTCCAALLLPFVAHAAEPDSATKEVTCETGPLNATFGKAPWLVYSCNDLRSLLFKAAPGNPAAPVFFFLYPKGTDYVIEGKGRGNKAVADAAYNEIKAMKVKDIDRLVEKTRNLKK